MFRLTYRLTVALAPISHLAEITPKQAKPGTARHRASPPVASTGQRAESPPTQRANPPMWPAPKFSRDEISPRFRLAEFARSVSHPSLVSQPPKQLWPNILALCAWGLEPVREHLGGPIEILSGFRNESLNKAVGGSPTSQHVRAEAVDITSRVVEALMSSIFELMERDQLAGLGQIIYYPTRGFVHLALRGNRFPFPMAHVHEPRVGLAYAPMKALGLDEVRRMVEFARTKYPTKI